jgi:peptidoglycan hydrolase-like protein with peptidoglycan-binding domain
MKKFCCRYDLLLTCETGRIYTYFHKHNKTEGELVRHFNKLINMTESGIAHIIMPAIAVAIVMAIGGYVYLYSTHAATTCYAQQWQQGSSGQCVKDAQNLLNYQLYGTKSSSYLSVDGQFGSYTKAAVQQEQKNNSITANGIVATQTWQALCASTSSGNAPSWYTAAASNAGCPASTSGLGSGGGSGSSPSLPYASALSSYSVLAQSYTASQMISGNWSTNANTTKEGGGTCPVANTTYDSANDAVKLSTNGTAANPGINTDCGHIRSASGVSTNGTVVESKVWLPSNSSGQLIDWASYWTDGVPTGGQSWPVTGELDAVETQYGVSYSSTHYGTNNTTMSTTPAGWGALPAPVNNAANDAVPGWNTVDIEFLTNWAGANVYINGKLYASFPASAIPHYSAYVNWGISGPDGSDPNHASWPSGPGYEEVQYLKVFTK